LWFSGDKPAAKNANVILMRAGDTKAIVVPVAVDESIVRDEWFPVKTPAGLDRYEIKTTQGKTGIFDYYAVFFDGHDLGEPNEIAKWIAKLCGVPATGNFVICHKVWVDDEEFNAKVDKSLKELRALFK